jgi:hypothetical protein
MDIGLKFNFLFDSARKVKHAKWATGGISRRDTP